MSVIQALHSIPPLETMPAWLLNLGVFLVVTHFEIHRKITG